VTRVTLKQQLREGKTVLGTFVHLGDPAVIEILGAAGLDYAIIDTEHSARDLSAVENMVRAAEAFGISPLIRVEENREKTILRMLETGAEGIVIPFVRTAQDVLDAQRAMRYPPDGARGPCTVTRAARYGALRGEFEEHTRRLNRELLLVGLIEDAPGVANVTEIMDAGLDVAFIARGDLTAALGVSAQSDHPRVLAAAEEIIDACEGRAEQWSGVMSYTPEESPRWIRRGCRFLAFSVDTYVLLNGFRLFATQIGEPPTIRVYSAQPE
jgi:2-keto-3-deoxy-L-rhamnonate aldolase RhmA